MNSIKNNLVIGGSSGLGKEIFDQLPNNKDNYVLDIKDTGNLKNNFNKVDVTKTTELTNCFNKFKEKKIKFDNVFISHGIHQTKPVLEITREEFDEVFRVNFFSVFEIIKNVYEILNENSKIIAISSIAACTPIPFSATYSSSKSALEALFLSFKNEFNEKKIKPIIVQPGNINTGFNETGNNYIKKIIKIMLII